MPVSYPFCSHARVGQNFRLVTVLWKLIEFNPPCPVTVGSYYRFFSTRGGGGGEKKLYPWFGRPCVVTIAELRKFNPGLAYCIVLLLLLRGRGAARACTIMLREKHPLFRTRFLTAAFCNNALVSGNRTRLTIKTLLSLFIWIHLPYGSRAARDTTR